MNKIYSKIWNRKLGQLVVASELASSDTTGVTDSCIAQPQRRALALALMAVLFSGQTFAGQLDGGTGGVAQIAYGPGANTSAVSPGSDAIAIGNGVVVGDPTATDAIAIGTQIRNNGQSAILMGNNFVQLDNASDRSVVFAPDGLAYGGAAGAYAQPVTNSADTFFYGSARALNTVTNSAGAVALSGSALDSADAVSIGTGAQVANAINGVALGAATTATANFATAVGSGADATETAATAVGSRSNAGGFASAAFGSSSSAAVDFSTALGGSSNVTVEGGVALGHDSHATTAGGVAGYDPATGLPSTQTDRVWVSTTGAVSVGGGTGDTVGGIPSTRQITNLAAGTQATDAVNVAQLQAAQAAATTHYFSVNDAGVQGGNYNNDGATGENSLAAGIGAQATSFQATAVGFNARALAESSTAMGENALANAFTSTAVGFNSVAAGQDGTALGVAANVTARGGTAVGGYSTAGSQGTAIGLLANAGANAAALGIQANASGDSATSLGRRSTASGLQAMAAGFQATASGGAATAVGLNSLASGGSSIALGVASQASGTNGVAIGTSSLASSFNSVAIGPGAQANGLQSISIGSGNIVNGARSGAIGDPSIINATDSYSVGNNNTLAAGQTGVFALGNNITTTISNSVALGSNSAMSAALTASSAGNTAYNSATLNDNTYNFAGGTAVGVVTMGGVGAERRIQNVAAGLISATSTDAVNGSQLYALVTEVNDKAPHFYSVNGSAVNANYNNNGATGTEALAAGVGTTAAGTFATAVGHFANASGREAIAIGEGVEASGIQAVAIGTASIASGSGALAIGNVANAAGASSVAVGNSSYAGALGSTALGVGAVAEFQNSVSIGRDARDSGANSTMIGASTSGAADSTALGYNASANNVGAVALGNNSVTAAVVNTPSITMNGTTYNFAGTAATSTVSIGAVGAERTLTNLAAGRISATSTDAINGSQLYAFITDVNDNATHYYSVNDNGVQGGNYANDGATGANSIASGVNATSTGDYSIAMGSGAQSIATGGVALGAASVANTAAGVAGYVPLNASAGDAAAILATTSTSGAVSVGDSGKGLFRQITGVAAGTADSDAVNVAQLRAVQGYVEGVRTHYYSVNDGGVQGGNYNNDGATGLNAMAGGVNSTASGNNGVAMGANSNAAANNSVAVGSGSQSTVDGGVALGAGSVSNTAAGVAGYVPAGATAEQTAAIVATTSTSGAVSVGDASTGLYRQITGVAAGTAASDAVNVAQLQALQNQVVAGETHYYSVNDGGVQGGNHANDGATGVNSMAAGVNSTATGTNSTAVGANSHATGTNSAALGAGSTASHANSVAIGNGSATTRGAQTNYNAAYVGNSTSTGEMNIGGRTITGVAPGIAPTDAVNVSQLTSGVNYAIDQSKAYTDARITNIEGDVWTMKRDFRGATSSAMAMAGLPQAYLPGKSMLAVGMGGYQGEYGVAVGLSGITENGRYVYKASASGNTSRDWGFSVGAGIQW